MNFGGQARRADGSVVCTKTLVAYNNLLEGMHQLIGSIELNLRVQLQGDLIGIFHEDLISLASVSDSRYTIYI